jgi:hypothetical protein
VRPTGPHGSELGSKTVAEKDGDSRCDPATTALEFGMGGERARSRFRICLRLWRRWSGLGDRPPAAESCGRELRSRAVVEKRDSGALPIFRIITFIKHASVIGKSIFVLVCFGNLSMRTYIINKEVGI